MEWKVHTDKMQNQDFEIARYAWCGDYNEASTYLDLFTSYSGHNNGKFLSEEYDALMKESKTAENPRRSTSRPRRSWRQRCPLRRSTSTPRLR